MSTIFTSVVQTRLQAKPSVRVRIHPEKYITCRLISYRPAFDPEDRFKGREYAIIEPDEIVLDVLRSYKIESDGLIHLWAGHLHSDDHKELQKHCDNLFTQIGHWFQLDTSTESLEKPYDPNQVRYVYVEKPTFEHDNGYYDD